MAGLGNMLVDEVLWWAGLDPQRPARSLTADEVAALQRSIRRRLPVMLRRGGSHTGTLSPAVRAAVGLCPRDGAAARAATSSAAARRSGVRLTSAEPGKIRGAVPAAPPLLGSTGSTTFVLAALLVALGVAMVCAAVWLVRATRTDTRRSARWR